MDTEFSTLRSEGEVHFSFFTKKIDFFINMMNGVII